jgi:hypothetical protein
MATIQTEVLEGAESALIRAWRREALERGGYDQQVAMKLAEHDEVDLHVAVDLLHRGCSQKLAARILL